LIVLHLHFKVDAFSLNCISKFLRNPLARPLKLNTAMSERNRINMKKFLIAAFTAGLLAICAAAQTSGSGSASVTPGQASAGAGVSQSTQAPGTSANANTSANAQASNAGSSLSSGTVLQAELSKSVDAKKAKPGDEVTAKLTQDVKSDGKIVLHRGSKLVGHITQAQAKSKENEESRLGVVFDKAIVKGGQEMSFNGVIQALAPPVQGTAAAAGDMDNMGSGRGSGTSMGGGRGSGSIAPMSGSGGVNSTLGSAAGTVGNAAGSVTNSAGGAVNGTVNQATSVAANGTLTSAARGVVGMEGVSLSSAANGSAQGSVISSPTHTVKLDGGTQMVLQVTGSAAGR
jgi:hypothetical protein